MSKACTLCRVVKGLDEFDKTTHKLTKHQRQPWCKECKKKQANKGFFKPSDYGWKFCTKCKELKPLSEFYKHVTTKDGLRYHCKTCPGVEGKRWSKDNPDKKRAQSKKHYVHIKAWREFYREHHDPTDEFW